MNEITEPSNIKPKGSSARPLPRYLVEVKLKSDFSDADGVAALALLNGAGLNTAHQVRVSQIYDIRGPLNQGHIHMAARDLLCDGVTQEFKLLSPMTPSPNGMNHWRVEVWLKPAVTDAVGDTVRDGLIELGLPSPTSVRCAAAYHITGKCGRNQLEKVVLRTLANPVIHTVVFLEEHA